MLMLGSPFVSYTDLTVKGDRGLVSIPAAIPELRDFPVHGQYRTGQILPPNVP